MGSSQTKHKINSPSEKVVEGLKNKVRVLQGEINEIMCIRESENQVYERELMVFAFKQAEWKTERKRLKDELKKMSKILEEKEEGKLRLGMESRDHFEKNEWEFVSILEHIKEEQARRDETVEKWKQLYFAIKVELDHLIQRTHHQEERVCWETEEEDLLMQLKAKEERIEALEAKLGLMEQQEHKREREMDILRQSLRIMCHNKEGKSTSCLVRG
ncbi:hypothetical protein BUALT_Bualt12G0104100 [Buddleja alternifolia]|uniref:Uncharacterized protein n=1 Tax=Buddleja alternifolia TaxID=168488 RepID=A0AAV6X0V3_9LAMI|nr:hypothetical protein BUALT_Bualt12G0104100 [Buddleja alternifolia]